MNNLFAELKRRNVVRVAIAYGVVAWVLLQGIDVVGDIMNLPDWIGQALLIILVVGFPIVLFISWAFEITPKGVMKTEEVDKSKSITHGTGHKINKLIGGALIVAVGFIIYDKTVDDAGVTEAVAGQASIAVLPFVNMSDDAANEYFADGLSEELLNVLAKVPDLKVAGRTSSFQFKGRNQDLREIGETLGVAHILEGSVRKQGNRVRITAQLIRAQDGFHMWSETYDRDLEDIFLVQDEISAAIFDQLSVTLGFQEETQARAVPTTNMEAYDRFLEARTLIARRGGANLTRAIQLLEQAVQLDRNYADAWAALAAALGLAPYYNVGDFSTYVPRGQAAAQRAIDLDPNLGSAHAAMGDALRDQQHWAEAEAEYKIALSLNPNEVETNSQYGQMLVRVGKAAEAEPFMLRAAELDPLSMIPPTVLSFVYHQTGRHQKETIFIEKGVVLDNVGFANYANMVLGLSHNDVPRQKEFLIKSHNLGIKEMSLEKILELEPLLGDPIQARSFLYTWFEYEKKLPNNVSFGAMIILAVHFGEFDLAVDVLNWQRNETTLINDTVWIWQVMTPEFLNHGGFKSYLKQAGIVDYWMTNGFPPGCHALGEGDYICE